MSSFSFSCGRPSVPGRSDVFRDPAVQSLERMLRVHSFLENCSKGFTYSIADTPCAVFAWYWQLRGFSWRSRANGWFPRVCCWCFSWISNTPLRGVWVVLVPLKLYVTSTCLWTVSFSKLKWLLLVGEHLLSGEGCWRPVGPWIYLSILRKRPVLACDCR